VDPGWNWLLTEKNIILHEDLLNPNLCHACVHTQLNTGNKNCFGEKKKKKKKERKLDLKQSVKMEAGVVKNGSKFECQWFRDERKSYSISFIVKKGPIPLRFLSGSCLGI
jgi:hypothetical protein